MTVTYSLDVANTRFGGFTKLLCRWKGSIYKILWKELLFFAVGYTLLSVTYRNFLIPSQKRIFEDIVIYCETFIDLIPLAFVLGFYVSLIIGRWWNQFNTIPWPDKTCLMIATFVHGSDERSRTIRRTLGRYLILMQMFTFQAVSTAVKKRFPSLDHVEAAGLMTKEEKTVFEKFSGPYGKWWLPVHWFCSLCMRARKEGRIKDSLLLETLIQEVLKYRSACGTMFSYDWISVPLVYTQVVTLATYTYSVALVVGRQYLDPERGFRKHEVDLYVPFFTILQFFFYIGWLKVAEQIVNPYGEDDDDFELSWCLDRSAQIVYNIVDHLHGKHPKLKRDPFWEEMEPRLPHTKFSADNMRTPNLGSAANLEISPEEAEFLPMETLLEEDIEAYNYDSMKRSEVRHRPSFLMRMFNTGRSLSRSSTQKGDSFRAAYSGQGHINPAFIRDRFGPRKGSVASTNSRTSSIITKRATPAPSRTSSIAIRKPASPSHSRSSSMSFKPGSISKHRSKFYDTHQSDDKNPKPNGMVSRDIEADSAERNISPADEGSVSKLEQYKPELTANTQESGSMSQKIVEGPTLFMPPIPEEPSRPVSLATLSESIESPNVKPDNDHVHDLVQEANKVLEQLNRAVHHHHGKRRDVSEYESCCSLSDSSEDNEVTSSGDNEIVDDEDDAVSVVVEPAKDGEIEEWKSKKEYL